MYMLGEQNLKQTNTEKKNFYRCAPWQKLDDATC